MSLFLKTNSIGAGVAMDGAQVHDRFSRLQANISNDDDQATDVLTHRDDCGDTGDRQFDNNSDSEHGPTRNPRII